MKIKELRRQKGISQATLGQQIGLTRAAICQYEQGRREPDTETLLKIAKYFNVSVDSLLEREQITININGEEITDQNAIPVMAADDSTEKYILTNRAPTIDYFALRTSNDSMANAGIPKNAIVIVHKQPNAESGNIIAAKLNGENIITRYKIYGGNIFLMFDNSTYEPISILKGADFQILGKVVEIRIEL